MNAKSLWPLVALLIAPLAHAQDPAKVAPDIYKCTFENEHSRLCEVTFKPGAKIEMHSHPQHMVYVLQPGKLRITPQGGKPADVDFTMGQVAWLPAEAHFGENIGQTELKAVIIEFKALKTNDKPMAKSTDMEKKSMDMEKPADKPMEKEPTDKK